MGSSTVISTHFVSFNSKYWSWHLIRCITKSSILGFWAPIYHVISHVIMNQWVSIYRYPISTFCIWIGISVIGYLGHFHANYIPITCLLLNVPYSFSESDTDFLAQKKLILKRLVLIWNFVVDVVNLLILLCARRLIYVQWSRIQLLHVL